MDLQNSCDIAVQVMNARPRIGADGIDRDAECTCFEDGTSFSCVESTCPSCSNDGSVCLLSTDFGSELSTDFGNPISYSSSYQYTKGRILISENIGG